MGKNPLQYEYYRVGKKPRECLPSKERESYIDHLARRQRYGKITLRYKNRYIDEFLRYTQVQFDHTSPQKVTADQMQSFVTHLVKGSKVKATTVRSKLIEIFQWFHWLREAKRILTNPLEDLSPTGLLDETIKKEWRR